MYSPCGPACISRRTEPKSLSAPDEEGPRCFDEEGASLPLGPQCPWRGKASLLLIGKGLVVPDKEEPWCPWWAGTSPEAILGEKGPRSSWRGRIPLPLMRKDSAAPDEEVLRWPSSVKGPCCPWRGNTLLPSGGKTLLSLTRKGPEAHFYFSSFEWRCLFRTCGTRGRHLTRIFVRGFLWL